jgi:cytochrome P450
MSTDSLVDRIDVGEIDPLDLVSPKRYGLLGPPHDLWRALRRDDPVHWCEPEGYQSFWAITRHHDITDISSRPDTFSNAHGIVVLNDQQVAAQERNDNPLRTMRTIIEMDPPDHRIYRKIASGFFTPRGIGELDQIVTASAQVLLDSLGDEGECDFIERIAQRHPLRVLATILGIDRDDEERLLELTQQLFASDDPDYQRAGDDRTEASKQVGLEFYAMFDRIIKDRRAHPRDDLATAPPCPAASPWVRSRRSATTSSCSPPGTTPRATLCRARWPRSSSIRLNCARSPPTPRSRGRPSKRSCGGRRRSTT